MKIIGNDTEYDISAVNIIEARHVGDFVIRIRFDNNEERLVDFKPFLLRSDHSSIKKYLNVAQFEQFKIVSGNLNWSDYDMIFPIEDLYEGKIG